MPDTPPLAELIFEHASVGLFAADADGRITACNAACAAMLGHERARVPGLNLFELTHPQDREAQAQQLQALRSGEVPRVELALRCRRQDGGDFWAHQGLAWNAASRCLIGEMRDVTAAHEAEARQQEQAEELAQVLELVPSAVFIAHDPDGEVITANPAGLAMLEVQGRHNISAGSAHAPQNVGPNRYFSAEGVELSSNQLPIQRALATHEVVTCEEMWAQLPSGRRIWISGSAAPLSDRQGRVRGAVASFVDITEQIEQRRGLAATAEQFRQLADNLPALAWMADADGDIFWFNRRWYEYTGSTPEEMAGGGWRRAHDPDCLPAVVERWQVALASGQPFEMTFPLRGADGGFRFFLTRALPLRDSSGRLTRWFGTNTDVTAEREVQAQLEKSQAALREVDLRKNEFITMLAHELRNPLGPLRTATAVLARLPESDVKATRMREVIERQVTQMARLLDDLLDVSRIARGRMNLDMAECDLGAVAAATAEDYRAELAAAGCALNVDVAGPLPVRADPARITQMVGNYLQNAMRFAPHSRVTVLAFARAGHAVVEVRDEGRGIEPARLERLFEPFTADRPREGQPGSGLGMGLALTRALAELQGGTVAARSEGPGQGASFEIRLPLVER